MTVSLGKAKKLEHSAASVLAALRNGPLPLQSHAWLYEVRDKTGWGRAPDRFADALVVSLWPSRGIWIAGIEAKVSRQDWLRELRDPQKSAAIQKFCNYWWVAAPAGVVEIGEVPETWGLYEIGPRQKPRAIKTAPKLDPEPLTQGFVASVLRSAGSSQESARAIGYNEGRNRTKTAPEVAELDELREAAKKVEGNERNLLWRAECAERELGRLRTTVAHFERAAGLETGTLASGSAGPFVGNAYRTAQILLETRPDIVAMQLRHAADAIAAVGALAVVDAAAAADAAAEGAAE